MFPKSSWSSREGLWVAESPMLLTQRRRERGEARRETIGNCLVFWVFEDVSGGPEARHALLAQVVVRSTEAWVGEP
jgi:hypothetical protein